MSKIFRKVTNNKGRRKVNYRPLVNVVERSTHSYGGRPFTSQEEDVHTGNWRESGSTETHNLGALGIQM